MRRQQPLTAKMVEEIPSIKAAERRRWTKDRRLPNAGHAFFSHGKKQVGLFVYPPEVIRDASWGPLMSLNLLDAETTSAPVIQLRPESLAPVPSEPAMQIIRRNGKVSPFDSAKIAVAMTKAFLAVEGNSAVASRRVHEIVEQLAADVMAVLMRRAGEGRTFHIEDVQDQVELALTRSENHKVARA